MGYRTDFCWNKLCSYKGYSKYKADQSPLSALIQEELQETVKEINK